MPLQWSVSIVAKARLASAPHVELIVRAEKGQDWEDFWKSAEDITAVVDWFDRHLKGRG